MEYKLAELLLRRKELADKLPRIGAIKSAPLFERSVTRKAVHEGIDEITATVPKLTLSQVTEEYDYYAHQLRVVDAAIQQTNWTAIVAVSEDVMKPYSGTNAGFSSPEPARK